MTIDTTEPIEDENLKIIFNGLTDEHIDAAIEYAVSYGIQPDQFYMAMSHVGPAAAAYRVSFGELVLCLCLVARHERAREQVEEDTRNRSPITAALVLRIIITRLCFCEAPHVAEIAKKDDEFVGLIAFLSKYQKFHPFGMTQLLLEEVSAIVGVQSTPSFIYLMTCLEELVQMKNEAPISWKLPFSPIVE